jgi:hypothetical protein
VRAAGVVIDDTEGARRPADANDELCEAQALAAVPVCSRSL